MGFTFVNKGTYQRRLPRGTARLSVAKSSSSLSVSDEDAAEVGITKMIDLFVDPEIKTVRAVAGKTHASYGVGRSAYVQFAAGQVLNAIGGKWDKSHSGRYRAKIVNGGIEIDLSKKLS